ncbi:MAG: DUF1648 domain-containing protein [Lysinibacillus sp.]
MHNKQKTPVPIFCKRLTMIVATIFVAAITATAIQFGKLPTSIPVLQHFNNDNAQFGPKIAIFYLPFVALMIFLLLHYLEIKAGYPMPRKNKETLSHAQRQNTIMTFCFIKNAILLYFTYSLWNDLAVGLGRERILQQWHAYFFLFVLFLIFMFGMIRGILLGNKQKS